MACLRNSSLKSIAVTPSGSPRQKGNVPSSSRVPMELHQPEAAPFWAAAAKCFLGSQHLRRRTVTMRPGSPQSPAPRPTAHRCPHLRPSRGVMFSAARRPSPEAYADSNDSQRDGFRGRSGALYGQPTRAGQLSDTSLGRCSNARIAKVARLAPLRDDSAWRNMHTPGGIHERRSRGSRHRLSEGGARSERPTCVVPRRSLTT